MLIVYVDETGDPTGHPDRGGSEGYGLGLVLLRAGDWADAFDGLLTLRRSLRQQFGVPARAEVKASYLVRGEGAIKGLGLSSSQRRYIYRRHLAAFAQLKLRGFSVYVNKRGFSDLTNVRQVLWDTAFQRLSLTADRDDPNGKSPILLIHDEGEELTIRRYARKARRYLTSGSAYGTGSLRLSTRWLLDDPVSRQSDQSLFVQCADLVAYAAAKRIDGGGSRSRRVCPPSMWDALGSGCHSVVNSLELRRDPTAPPGIVRR